MRILQMYLLRKKTLFAVVHCPERKQQLFEGAEKYEMVEMVPEEAG